MINNKVILSDIDGVMLDWETAFAEWMANLGHTLHNETARCKATRYKISMSKKDMLVKMFFNSARIGFLPAYRDSIEYVTKLGEKGYTFVAITSFSDDYHAGLLRKMNLENLFGDVFRSYNFLYTGSYKKQALAPYVNSNKFWIEDSITNAKDGHKLGLRSILMEDDHSRDVVLPFPKVNSWREIYEHVTS